MTEFMGTEVQSWYLSDLAICLSPSAMMETEFAFGCFVFVAQWEVVASFDEPNTNVTLPAVWKCYYFDTWNPPKLAGRRKDTRN